VIKSRIKSEGIGPETLAVGRYNAGKHPTTRQGSLCGILPIPRGITLLCVTGVMRVVTGNRTL